MKPIPSDDSEALASSDPSPELVGELERHRVELTGYSYRMLGSPFDAEDAVQETMMRALRGLSAFEGRAALRSWLYRIATNVCLDMLQARKKRARPLDLGPAGTPDSALGAPLPESTWIEPIPDPRVLPVQLDPSEQLAQRQTVRLAFLAALQLLPPLQRAVLILREVLQFHADEVAELLETSVAASNSALQRARATLATKQAQPLAPEGEHERSLLARYVAAFEGWDVDSLVALLHEDATLTMPPFALWLRGSTQLRRWFEGPGAGCRGSLLVPVRASGAPAFAQYKPRAEGSGHEPFALHVLELAEGRIIAHDSFLDTARLFPLFGLPLHP